MVFSTRNFDTKERRRARGEHEKCEIRSILDRGEPMWSEDWRDHARASCKKCHGGACWDVDTELQGDGDGTSSA